MIIFEIFKHLKIQCRHQADPPLAEKLKIRNCGDYYMIILGIDPGYGRCGWAILAKQEKSQITITKNQINPKSQIQNSKDLKSYKPCLPAGRLQATSLIDCDCIETDSKNDLPDRLKEIYDAVEFIIKKYKPDSLAIESLFFFKNQKTVMQVSQARGVIIIAAKNYGLKIYEYTPLQTKLAVVGYGRGNKEQIQKMIKLHLCGQVMPKQDDTADAVAIALTHMQTINFKKQISNNK
jgi:crossover junction endodeoxyribonuclease RuvC